MKLECSSQRIPRAVVLGLLELNCDWLKIPTSQKSFPSSGSQTLFSAETSDSRKYVCVRRLGEGENLQVCRWTVEGRPFRFPGSPRVHASESDSRCHFGGKTTWQPPSSLFVMTSLNAVSDKTRTDFKALKK